MKKASLAFGVILFLASCQKDITEAYQPGSPELFDTVTFHISQYAWQPYEISVTCGQTLVVVADTHFQNVHYLWSPTGDTTESIIIPSVADGSVTVYTILYMSAAVDSVPSDTITTTAVIVIGKHEPQYYVPSAFTPNGDGLYDVYYASAICYSATSMKIYDSFSNTLLFESYDINIGWDGSYKGKMMAAGDYRYQFEITSNRNEVFTTGGYMQLVR